MENIRQDFENELRRINFSFDESIKGHEDYLFNEFKELPAVPKVELYIADKMDLKALGRELMTRNLNDSESKNNKTIIAANYVPTGELENKYSDLRNEFYSLPRQTWADLDKKYYGRYLESIPAISKLKEIDNKMRLLTDYVLKHSNIDNYRNYAGTTAKVINKLLEGMPFRNKIITKILEKESPSITIKFMFKECSEEAHGRYCEIIDILSELLEQDIQTATNQENESYLDQKNIFNGQPLSEVREHLKELCKGKIFTQNQLDNFIKRAFCGDMTISKITINDLHSSKGAIGKTFHKYRKSIVDEGEYFSNNYKNDSNDYINLVCENINGLIPDKFKYSFRK